MSTQNAAQAAARNLELWKPSMPTSSNSAMAKTHVAFE